ncbi:MAG: aminotransferase class IV [Bacteroidales bacterium]|nr:aminotransferase class IV [Bacteroidales bacterium]
MNEIAGDKYIINGLEKPVSEGLDLDISTSVIYDVVRIEEGIPLFLDDYLDRLENSFRLTICKSKYNRFTIVKTIKDLVKINGLISGPVKLIFGCGNSEFLIAHIMRPNLRKQQEYIAGVKTILLHTERLNPNAKVWNHELRELTVKLLNKNDSYEAILVNNDGFITEGSRSNIFFIKDDMVVTTPKDLVLQGITRKKVLEVCKQTGINVEMKNIHYNQIHEYDVCFLTGTSRKIVPIKSIDNCKFTTSHKLLQQIFVGFENLVSKYIRDNQEII